ncbi:Shedu immune nuclease family protein [Nonomuraea sp. NPDC049607]|uniref:Shedu immune nuclease family protein n=1 Tax=Nonomuraea sp. NPDC049607 TaxID=3154732 RepID=UPI00342B4FD1
MFLGVQSSTPIPPEDWTSDGALLFAGVPEYGRSNSVNDNDAIIQHIRRGKALRIFLKIPTAKDIYSYLGEFVVDQRSPVAHYCELASEEEAYRIAKSRHRLISTRVPFLRAFPVTNGPAAVPATVARQLYLDAKIQTEGTSEDAGDDEPLLRDILGSPSQLLKLYQRHPDRFRELISDDASARDVIAIAHRREQVEHFRRLLFEDSYFDSMCENSSGRGPESVWQEFFEKNTWILGASLAGQLLTSWNHEKLEQVVVGQSVSGAGKRTDALLHTAGRVKSMVFAEFKTHRTPLLEKPYRSGCWSPSRDLVGGIAQVQGTVHRCVQDIRERLSNLDLDGSELGDYTYLIRPRSFLIVGRLDQLIGRSGGDHSDRIRSFELFRRNLSEPEVVTYDELLSKADWIVSTAHP